MSFFSPCSTWRKRYRKTQSMSMWKRGLTQVHVQDLRDCVAYFDTQFECSLTSLYMLMSRFISQDVVSRSIWKDWRRLKKVSNLSLRISCLQYPYKRSHKTGTKFNCVAVCINIKSTLNDSICDPFDCKPWKQASMQKPVRTNKHPIKEQQKGIKRGSLMLWYIDLPS